MKFIKALSAALIAALCALSLAGCSIGSTGGYADYPDADKYTVGDASINGTVEALDIDWPAGTVDIVAGSGSAVNVSEKTEPADLEDDMRMRWYLDGTTLRIKYMAPSVQTTGFKFSLEIKKHLTVELPESIALSDVVIGAASADITAGGFSAKNIAINSSSGDISFSQKDRAASVALGASSGDITAVLTGADAVSVGTSSGNIRIRQSGRVGSADRSASSGQITADLGDVREFKAGTSSGRITVSAKSAPSARLSASSGEITCGFGKMPESLDIGTSSGDVRLTLPADASFTADIKTSSGDVKCGFYALTDNEGTYVVGDGAAKVSIGTSSGDVTVQPEK